MTGRWRRCPGKLEEYVGYTKHGLNTIELDLKDEGGDRQLQSAGAPAGASGSARRGRLQARAGRTACAPARRLPDRPRRRASRIRCSPLRGRISPSRRPVAAPGRRRRGSRWVNPYDKRVWEYAVSVAEVAAKAGFDEIMLDYVRFPSDGDVERAVYPGRTSQARGRVIADFVAYAQKRLKPSGVRDLDGGVRAVGDTRSAHRPGAEVDLRTTSTTSTRWPIRSSTAAASSASRNRAPSPARPSSGRSRTSGAGAPRHGRPARPVDPGLELRPGAGAAPDRGRAAPGSQGLPALERRRAATRKPRWHPHRSARG